MISERAGGRRAIGVAAALLLGVLLGCGGGDEPTAPRPPYEGLPEGDLSWTLGTLEVMPGARLDVAVRATPGGPWASGTWYSADSDVASWTAAPAFEQLPPGGMELTAHRVGETTIAVVVGERAIVREFRVRDPGQLTMDELGSCGLAHDGTLWCEGSNEAGELATLTGIACRRACRQLPANVPIRGAAGMRFRSLTSSRWGYTHSCAIGVDDSRAYCWGFNHGVVDTAGRRLGGASERQFCPEESFSLQYQLMYCSFAPLAVDRELGRQLVFRTIKAVRNVTCGTTGEPGAPGEIWCWGDTRIPTKRDSFPAGWPAAGS